MNCVEGTLDLLGFPELLQIAGFNHRSFDLALLQDGVELGVVQLRDGQIVSARCGSEAGLKALQALAQQSTGALFRLTPAEEEVAPRTVTASLGGVLMRLMAVLPPAAEVCEGTVAGCTAVFSVQEILQLFEANRRPCTCTLGSGEYELTVKEGALAAARCRDGRGPEAVYSAIAAPSLPFQLAPAAAPPADDLWDIASVLMEGLRRRDEEALLESEIDPASNPHAQETLQALEQGSLSQPERLELARRYLPGGATAPAAVLVPLSVDSDPDVRATALASLEDVPGPVLEVIASDPETPPALLEYLLLRKRRNKELIPVLLANEALPPAAAAAVIPTVGSAVLVGLLEREALLRDPGVCQALLDHPECGFKDRLHLPETQPTRSALRRVPFGGMEKRPAPPPAEKPSLVLEPPPDDRGVKKVERRPTLADLLMVAQRGPLRERQSLTAHANDTVAEAAISSPGLPDVAIEAIAASTSTNPVCFKIIGGNPRWKKMSGIVQALLFNPKTPVTVSRGFVQGLRSDVLEKISRNRDLPDGLRQLALKRLSRKH